MHPDLVTSDISTKCSSRSAVCGSTCGERWNVLDILIQGKQDGRAATRFFRTLLKKQGHSPRVLVTDKLASYRVAHRQIMSTVEHRQNKYLNNRCENSHQPTRQRGRAMKGFRTVGSAQRFFAALAGSLRISAHPAT